MTSGNELTVSISYSKVDMPCKTNEKFRTASRSIAKLPAQKEILTSTNKNKVFDIKGPPSRIVVSTFSQLHERLLPIDHLKLANSLRRVFIAEAPILDREKVEAKASETKTNLEYPNERAKNEDISEKGKPKKRASSVD
uniref:Uncharacterized protein n=1 Tax=Glossina austeni TaxID=7395 RepID=A0A1A9UWJ9_GLOAU